MLSFSFISNFLSQISSLLLCGFIISNISFIISSLILYRITSNIFHDHKYAYITSLIFISSPANIFFTSLYTESLFALFTFTGIWFLIQDQELLKRGKPEWKIPRIKHLILASLMFALGASTRSNGIIFVGLMGYPFFNFYLNQLLNRKFNTKVSKFINSIQYSL